ncbi:hypothetical protein WH47_00261 [Habropoda laboriosa]|uniref:Uncharacterized protein n=1 Tax=Habropoda laboriosa TaxID=597456 RepID=A0A0L7R1N9_9HYME|nr:hypothetical protein WH47_00261 [Habropoda laboriosa]
MNGRNCKILIPPARTGFLPSREREPLTCGIAYQLLSPRYCVDDDQPSGGGGVSVPVPPRCPHVS